MVDRLRLARSVFQQETPELLAAAWVPELSWRARFYLPDALAGNVELFADFLERVVGPEIDAEAHAQHFAARRVNWLNTSSGVRTGAIAA